MNRKTMRKLQLIQWACFQNEIVNLNGSVLFTGVNGSGKSTVLDAVSYLLCANTQFNVAAKDRDRTVKAYVRGDTKSNGKDQFLRNGEVVGYLAAEFSSGMDGTSFVVGVCIESPNAADKCNSYWFVLKDTVLSDVRMTEEKDRILYVYPRKQMTVKGKTLKMSDFMTREKAKPQITRVLGLRCDPEKYRTKLVKMMAFNPENNIDQFIQNCVLEPGNVNSLKELRGQKERFEEYRGIYENLKVSRDKLEQVESVTVAFEMQRRQYRNRYLMQQYQEVLFHEEEQEEILRRQAFLKSRLAELDRDLKGLEKKRNAAQKRYDAARTSTGFQSIQSSIDAINNQITQLSAQIQDDRTAVEQLMHLRHIITDCREVFEETWQFTPESERVFDALGSRTFQANVFQEQVQAFLEEKDALDARLREEQYVLTMKREDVRGRIAEINKCLRDLEQSRIPYPKGPENTRRILEQELRKQYPDTRVRFFAELVQEVKDQSWRKAIETFLGRKRFYMIVDNDKVGEALRILNEKKLHDTNLVITDRLTETETKSGTAAEMLVIPNTAARRYANYLLNGIVLCDSVDELHNNPRGGIMRDGMLAKSYSAAMMDMSRTLMFMGADAVRLQEVEYRREKEVREAEEKRLSTEMKTVLDKLNVLKTADIRLQDYRFSAPFTLMENEEVYERTRAEKEKLESDPGFVEIMEEVNRAKAQLEDYTEQIREKDRETGDIRTAEQTERENRKKIAGEIFVAKNRYEEVLAQYPELEREMKADYEKLRVRAENARVIKGNTVEHLRTDTDRKQKEMEDAQLAYLKAAGINLEKRGVSFIPFFREEKRLIANVKIEEASNKLETHAREMETTFMTDFVAEINESILLAKKEVELINSELRRLPFGADTYAFVMDERGDRSDFFRICNKLNQFGSVEMLQGMNANDEELTHDIASFMNKILSEPDETEFTDYRKYFKYDMKIRTKRGGDEIEADFSRKQGSASNGEKQTPYFIILAASLMQCYPRNTECARLAMIDEAFAALSRERIEQMVGYLEDNGFQVLYAAPPEKIASIGDLIDTTVSLVISGKYTKTVEGLTKTV